MDGRSLGHGTDVRWPLSPGRHQLELLDERGQLLQRVRFVVRPGLRPRATTGAALQP
jgi:penicillin-binding protein 1C